MLCLVLLQCEKSLPDVYQLCFYLFFFLHFLYRLFCNVNVSETPASLRDV